MRSGAAELCQRAIISAFSLDHLVGAQYKRVGEIVMPSALAVFRLTASLELRWLLDRQIGRLRAAQDFVNQADDVPITQDLSRSIGEQCAILRALWPLVDRRQAENAHSVDHLQTSQVQKRRGQHINRIDLRRGDIVKCD